MNVPAFLPLNTAAYDAETATKSKIAPTFMARIMFIANLLVSNCNVVLVSNDSTESLYTESANTEILHSNNCDSNIDVVTHRGGFSSFYTGKINCSTGVGEKYNIKEP